MSILAAKGAERAMQRCRYARYRTARKHRRWVTFAWTLVAATTLFGAWDMAGRIDERAYSSWSSTSALR